MKLSNQKLIFALVAFMMILFAQQMYSYYTANKCDNASQTFVSGYRCYTKDKKSFNQNIKACADCTAGVWSNS